MFSAFAFFVAAGLSLEGSPFCERIRDDLAPEVAASVSTVRHDVALAGTYETIWGRVELRDDGTARARSGNDGGRVVDGTWHVRDGALSVQWPTGSFVLAKEWWQRPPRDTATATATAATCTSGSC